MIYKIVEKLVEDLNNEVGPNSTYSSDKVERVEKRLPEDVLFNRFIGVIKRDRRESGHEIGQRMPRLTTYRVDIAILVKSLDADSGDKILGIIERRVLKALSTTGSNNLRSLSWDEDDVLEQVNKVNFSRSVYDSGILKRDNNKSLHLSVITVEVQTQLTI